MKKIILLLGVSIMFACTNTQDLKIKCVNAPNYYIDNDTLKGAFLIESYLGILVSDETDESKKKLMGKIVANTFESDGVVSNSLDDLIRDINSSMDIDYKKYIKSFEQHKLKLVTDFKFSELPSQNHFSWLHNDPNVNNLFVYVYAETRDSASQILRELSEYEKTKTKPNYIFIDIGLELANNVGRRSKLIYAVVDIKNNTLHGITDDWKISQTPITSEPQNEGVTLEAVADQYGFVVLKVKTLTTEVGANGLYEKAHYSFVTSGINTYNGLSEESKYRILDKYTEEYLKHYQRVIDKGSVVEREIKIYDSYEEASESRMKIMNGKY
jgi:hypothetical protein